MKFTHVFPRGYAFWIHNDLSCVNLLRNRSISSCLRSSFARRRNRFYTRSEKLLALVLRRRTLHILISEKLDWIESIKSGFRRTRHIVEFGPIRPELSPNYDLVIPLNREDTQQTRACPDLEKRNLIPLPSEQCTQLCNDKYEFNRTLINSELARFIPKMGVGLHLPPPYILKKRIGYWGVDCHIISNYEDENSHRDLIRDPDFFCQEIIPGPREFATHILFLNNRIVKALNVMYEFATDTPIKGQHKVLYTVIHRCPYLKLFSEVLRTIGFQGLCCVNYKVAHKQPYILEINPRFGGSLSPYFFSFLRHLP